MTCAEALKNTRTDIYCQIIWKYKNIQLYKILF